MNDPNLAPEAIRGRLIARLLKHLSVDRQTGAAYFVSASPVMLQQLPCGFGAGTSGLLYVLSHALRLGEQQQREELEVVVGSLALGLETQTQTMNPRLLAPPPFSLGFAAGGSGAIPAFHAYGELTGDWDCFEKCAVRLCEQLLSDDLSDHDPSFYGGLASPLFFLARYHEQIKTPKCQDAILRISNHLIDVAQPIEAGSAWVSAGSDGHMVTGLSWGSTGIILSLLAAHNALEEPRWLGAVLEGFEFERAQKDVDCCRWFNVVEHQNQDFSHEALKDFEAVCHGAVGIGMLRLFVLKHTLEGDWHQEIKQDLQDAIERSLWTADADWNGSKSKLSHCCGLSGLLDLLVETQALPGFQHLTTNIKEVRSRLMTLALQFENRPLGVVSQTSATRSPEPLEGVGFSSGLAGVYHSLLQPQTSSLFTGHIK